MEVGYRRYLLIKQIDEFIKPYKLKYTELIESTLYFMLYLMDSYNDIDMLKDILYTRLKTKNLIPNNTELNFIVDNYIKLYQNEAKITVPKLTATDIDKIKDQITKCAYNIYKNIANDTEIINACLFYNYEFSRASKKYINPDIISEILTKIKTEKFTEICSNIADASSLELIDKFTKIKFNLHTFNVAINKPFGATDHYLSDNFNDNSIIYLSHIPEFNMGYYLLNTVFPAILKKYKNICIIMINRFYYYNYLIDMIKKLTYIKYQLLLDLDTKDIISCNIAKSSPQIYGFIAHSDDFAPSNFNVIKDIMTKYQKQE